MKVLSDSEITSLQDSSPFEAETQKAYRDLVTADDWPSLEKFTFLDRVRHYLQLPLVLLYLWIFLLITSFSVINSGADSLHQWLLQQLDMYYPISWVYGMIYGLVTVNSFLFYINIKRFKFSPFKIAQNLLGSAARNAATAWPNIWKFISYPLLAIAVLIVIGQVLVIYTRETTLLQLTLGGSPSTKGLWLQSDVILSLLAVPALYFGRKVPSSAFFNLSLAALFQEFLGYTLKGSTLSREMFDLAQTYPALYLWSGMMIGPLIYWTVFDRALALWPKLALIFWAMVSAHIFWHLDYDAYAKSELYKPEIEIQSTALPPSR